VNRADVVIANSDAMNRKGQQLYGYAPTRGVVIPHGLPDRPLPPGPTTDGRLVFASPGPRRGPQGYGPACSRRLARVLPEFPNVAYRFIGPNLPEYLGRRPDLRTIWERSAGGVPGPCGRPRPAFGWTTRTGRSGPRTGSLTPSRFESFGLMAAEAMRAGTPVVYAAVGGLAEVGAKGPDNVAVKAIGDAADLERGLREGLHARSGPRPRRPPGRAGRVRPLFPRGVDDRSHAGRLPGRAATAWWHRRPACVAVGGES